MLARDASGRKLFCTYIFYFVIYIYVNMLIYVYFEGFTYRNKLYSYND